MLNKTTLDAIKNIKHALDITSYRGGFSDKFRHCAAIMREVYNPYKRIVNGNKTVSDFAFNPEYDSYIEFNDLTLNEFCDTVSSEIYDTINEGLEEWASHVEGYDGHEVWEDYTKRVNNKTFSSFLHDYLTLDNFVCYRDNNIMRIYTECFACLESYAKKYTNKNITARLVK